MRKGECEEFNPGVALIKNLIKAGISDDDARKLVERAGKGEQDACDRIVGILKDTPFR